MTTRIPESPLPKTGLKPDHDQFHAHLDICDRCRNQPFNLCSDGSALLWAAAKAITGKLRG